MIIVSAPDTSALQPTEELLRAHHPDAPITGELGGHSAVFDTTRAREVLGLVPRHRWRGTSHRPRTTDGKPVVGAWGPGFADEKRPFTPEEGLDVIRWFRDQGCCVTGGVPTH